LSTLVFQLNLSGKLQTAQVNMFLFRFLETN